MKSGKPQLIGALSLLVAAIFYNVWAFTRPAAKASTPRGPAPVDALPVLPAASAAVDPLTITAPRDVAIDSVPEWRLDPFTNAYEHTAVAVAPAGEATPAPQPEPEVVVSTILFGGDRQLAIVNGRIVRVGDSIGGSTVAEIQPGAVVLDGGPLGHRSVSLRTPGVPRGAMSKGTR